MAGLMFTGTRPTTTVAASGLQLFTPTASTPSAGLMFTGTRPTTTAATSTLQLFTPIASTPSAGLMFVRCYSKKKKSKAAKNIAKNIAKTTPTPTTPNSTSKSDPKTTTTAKNKNHRKTTTTPTTPTTTQTPTAGDTSTTPTPTPTGAITNLKDIPKLKSATELLELGFFHKSQTILMVNEGTFKSSFLLDELIESHSNIFSTTPIKFGASQEMDITGYADNIEKSTGITAVDMMSKMEFHLKSKPAQFKFV